MPYRSQAQRRAFHAKAARGEIDPATVREFDRSSKGRSLPERVGGAQHKDTEIPMTKLSKGGFQRYLAKGKSPQKDVPGPGKDPMAFGDAERGEDEQDGGPACSKCGKEMVCPECMKADEEAETPEDEAKESPSYQRAESALGIEKHK